MEKLYFFLCALAQISKAECILNHGHEFETILSNYILIDPKATTSLSLVERLDKAVTLYWKALATLKVIYFISELVRKRYTRGCYERSKD